MNVLDENVSVIQRQLLRNWRIPIRQIGYDTGRKGMTDQEIIPFLLTMRRPTFFTLDEDFYTPQLCHARYCLVFLDTSRQECAHFVRRFLRHSLFDTQAKRMGAVVRVSHPGLFVWRLHAEAELSLGWE